MSYLHKKFVQDIDVIGKKIIMRVDFNVPIKHGVISDDTRIVASLPTIKYLLERNAALILMSHLGRPKGKFSAEDSLQPVALRLEELLAQPVAFIPDCVGPVAQQAAKELQQGRVLLLENLRFHPEEEKNDPAFAKELASLAEIYVSDAFGVAHRSHASTVGIISYLPAVAGLLLEKEMQTLGKLLLEPERPYVAVIGGAKITDKIEVIESLVHRVDKLLIGGGMSNIFLAAAGHDMHGSLMEPDRVAWAAAFLQTPAAFGKIVLPVDLVAASAFAADADCQVVGVDNIPDGWTALDIGPATVALFQEELEHAKSVFWNGPLGVFEMEPFANGTMSIAKTIANLDAFTVIGGGDSIAAVNQAGVAEKIGHISTGGGASLEFLEGKILPGVNMLNDK